MSANLTNMNGRKALTGTGLRVTSQRALILEIVRRGQGHLDADEVYRLAREKQPRLSLSTVYRTLQTMKKAGLVDEVHFDEAHHHYELKTSAEHHHLVCLGCGRIIEFDYDLVRQIEENVLEAKEFNITGTEFHINGYCAECKNEKT